MAKDHTFDFLENESDLLDLSSINLDQELEAIFSGFKLDFSSDMKSDTLRPEEAPEVSPEKKEPAIPEDGFVLSPSPALTADTAPVKDDHEDPSADEAEEEPKRKKSLLNVFLILVALLLIGGIAGVLLLNMDSDPYDNRILNNVSIAGVDVSAMTKEEALAAVNSAVGTSYYDTAMVVTLGKNQIILSPSSTHANLNASQAVELAYALGRSGSAAECQKTYRLSQTSQIVLDITNALNLDVAYIRSTLEAAADQIGNEYIPSGYALIGEMPPLDADSYDSSFPCQTLTLTIGQPAAQINLDTIYNKVLEAYSQRNFQLVFPEEEIGQYPQALDLNAIYEEISIAPVEAKEDPVTREVTPGSCGYTFSLQNAQELVDAAGYGDVVTIPMEYDPPANLELYGIYSEVLSTYSTPVSDDAAYNANMKLVCQVIDGTVIEPGQVFSLYSAVGNRLTTKGYETAPSHAGCCIYEEIGGGTDQVASTLYVAALLSDLPVIERHFAHHICPYTILGTEVTISGTWQDLKFRNHFDTPVKIHAKVTSGQVTILILGQKALDYTITLDSTVSYPYAFGTMIVDKRADSGYENNQVLIEGVDGGQVVMNIIKCDKETGQEISRKTEYTALQPITKVIASVK